jgi:hypothetical protein
LISKSIAVATVVVAFALTGVACKKSVDPNAFDAGVQPVATVAAVPSTPTEAPDAALAALATSTAPVVKKAPPKDGGTDAAAAAAPSAPAAPTAIPPAAVAACNNAKTMCGSPKVATDAKMKKLCEDFKAECISKGGKI